MELLQWIVDKDPQVLQALIGTEIQHGFYWLYCCRMQPSSLGWAPMLVFHVCSGHLASLQFGCLHPTCTSPCARWLTTLNVVLAWRRQRRALATAGSNFWEVREGLKQTFKKLPWKKLRLEISKKWGGAPSESSPPKPLLQTSRKFLLGIALWWILFFSVWKDMHTERNMFRTQIHNTRGLTVWSACKRAQTPSLV